MNASIRAVRDRIRTEVEASEDQLADLGGVLFFAYHDAAWDRADMAGWQRVAAMMRALQAWLTEQNDPPMRVTEIAAGCEAAYCQADPQPQPTDPAWEWVARGLAWACAGDFESTPFADGARQLVERAAAAGAADRNNRG